MPILEKEIDVTVQNADILDNFRVLDGTDAVHSFSFYRDLTEAFNNALFAAFDEINETGILNITHQQAYGITDTEGNKYCTASFNVFGCDFNVFMYETFDMSKSYDSYAQYYCPRVAIIRQFATLPAKDAMPICTTSTTNVGISGTNNTNSATGLMNSIQAKMTEYKNRLRLCFKLVINYNEDFIDISFRNTAVNTDGYNCTLPIFTAIKCQSITYRNAVYYCCCCNLSILSYHRLVFLDDIKNTYLGDNITTTYVMSPSSISTTEQCLFLQIDVSNKHFTNLLQADNTRLELYKPICCTGFIQFSDNIMCAFDDAKVVPGEYYNVNDSIYYCPGSNMNTNTYRHLILKVE